MKYGQEYIARPILDDLGKGVTGHEHMGDLIRCKECKHWESMPSSTAAPEIHRCRYWRHIGTVAFDYCSKAERKEE